MSKTVRQLVELARSPGFVLLTAGVTLLVLAINDVFRPAASVVGAALVTAWLVYKVGRLERQVRALRHETAAHRASTSKLRQRVGRVAGRLKAARQETAALRTEVRKTERRVTDLVAAQADALRSEATERSNAVDGSIAALRHDLATLGERTASLDRSTAGLSAELRQIEAAGEQTREIAVDSNRHLAGRLDALGDLIGHELSAVPVSGVTEPILSIAIPSYNRPSALAHCLESVIDQLDDSGRVEVWITDDASPDVAAARTAHDLATAHPQLGFVPLAENIGLERNLIRCLAPCRGRHVLILGNDDALLDGALATILADLEADDLDLLLYEKTRFSTDLSQQLPAVPGSTPIEIPAGSTHRFASPFEVAETSGLLSAFGFISQVVFRREPFLGVDAEQFFGLTMYPQVAIMLAAFADSPVSYRNEPTVVHRTSTQATKLVESIGRREESFMTGGRTKAVNWFGHTLAAMLQRAADAGGFGADRYQSLPEHLFSPLPLVQWIERNIGLAQESDVSPAPDVIADAERFLASAGTAVDAS